MIDEQDMTTIREMVATEIAKALNGRITQMMIPSDTIKQRHVGEGVRYLRQGLASEKPTLGELKGATFFATDTNVLYIWNGSAWVSETFT